MPSPSRWLIAACLGLLALSQNGVHSAEAQPVQVQTADGRVIEGELLAQTDESLLLTISGIEARLPKSEVTRLIFREPPQVEYERVRANLQDDDLEGRLRLARQMLQRQAYPQAERELKDLADQFAELPAIVTLRNQVAAEQRLREARASAATKLPAAPASARPRDTRAQPITDAPYLTAAQIGVIKVYETDTSTQPRVTVPAATIDKLFANYANDPRVPRDRDAQKAFRRMPGYEQLAVIFAVAARDLYPDVVVRTEPAAMSEFRTRVSSGYMEGYFEPMFGRGQIDGFQLLGGRADSEPVAYTNFYLLQQYTNNGFRMIDRDSPADSLLLQWGLPRELARNPAPEVPRWSPRFRTVEDPEYRRVYEWIDSLIQHDATDYGITYPPAEGADAP